MPFQPTDDVASCELRYTWQGENVENRLHFFRDGFTPADLLTLATECYTSWASYFSPITSNTVTLREAYATDLRTEDGPTATYAPGTLVTGINVNESVTNNTALCLSLRTALRGRSRRGRFYTVGLTENVVANNRVSEAARTAWVQALTDLQIAVELVGWQLVVLSRVSGGVPRPVASSATVTQILTVDDVVDSQRRRLPGRGA